MVRPITWFRMYSEAVDDEKLRLLAFEDRWHFVAILCCKAKGILDEDSDLMRRKIAVKLGLDMSALDEVARRLAEVGLIDGKTLQPVAWDARQFKTDSSAERVAAYRERKSSNLQAHAARNVTVTARNGYSNDGVTLQETETETETETSNTYPTQASGLHVSPAGERMPAATRRERCPYQDIVAAYHEALPDCRHVEILTEKRKTHVRARWENGLPDLDAWREYFAYVAKSKFLTGQIPPAPGKNKRFQVDFDWLINETNLVKVSEGKYHG